MSAAPSKTIKDISTEIYQTNRKWHEFWIPREYIIFIIRYTDGTERTYKAKRGKDEDTNKKD